MLLNFTFKNWKSFAHKTKFSMIASREKQHGDRLPRVKKFGIRILPIASIYGGNASGKTNLFMALSFAKHFIVKGTSLEGSIAVETFKLNREKSNKTSEFKFELLIDELIYEYSFVIDSKRVYQEKLIVITSTSEKTLFSRQNNAMVFGSNLANNERLQFVFEGTRDNQLFLTNSVYQKIDNFKMVYNWFRNTLELLAPDSRFETFEQFFQDKDPLRDLINLSISQLDTGIDSLKGEDIPFESLNLPADTIQRLKENIKEGLPLRIVGDSANERIVFLKKNGELQAQKLVTYHKDNEGNPVKFEIRQESDGSKRIIDLLPAFLDLSLNKNKVYVIDEVDRSIHSLLTRKLIENYLISCNENCRSQL